MLNEQDDEESQTYESIFDGLGSSNRFVLLGGSGSGKTTTLRRMVLKAARERLRDPAKSPVPVLIDLSRWVDRWSFGDLLIDSAATKDINLQAGRFLLILDALNELGNPDGKLESLHEWLAFNDRSGGCIVGISCRKADYPAFQRGIATAFGESFESIEIKPLDAHRIQRFVGCYLEDPTAFLQASTGLPAELLSNPYLLTALLALFRSSTAKENETAALPRNMGVLFRRLVALLWQREHYRNTAAWTPLDRMEPKLAKFAFRMIADGAGTGASVADVARELGAESLVWTAQSAQILEVDSGRVRFSHQLIQDYFAAVDLPDHRLESVLPRVGFSVGNNTARYWKLYGARTPTRWDGVVVAHSGISQTPDDFILQVARLDPILASRCVRNRPESNVPTKKEVAAALISLARTGKHSGQYWVRHEVVFALDHVDWMPECVELQAWYLISKGRIRECADLGVAAASELVRLLKTESDKDERAGILRALGAIGEGDGVATAIYEHLRDLDQNPAEAAVDALAGLRGKSALPVLLKALEYRDSWALVLDMGFTIDSYIAPYVRRNAAIALGAIGDVTAMPALVKALGDEEAEVRKAAEDALAKIRPD